MGGPNGAPRAERPQGGGRRSSREATPQVWQPRTKAQPQNMSFEDMMSRFKSQSEEKMADLDHETSNRRVGVAAATAAKRKAHRLADPANLYFVFAKNQFWNSMGLPLCGVDLF
jgi:hypothetical protein